MAGPADTPAAAADLLMEVAAIRARQGRGRDAEAQYRRVLGMRPDDEIARARLENLYRNEGRWVELAASLEERTDPRLGSAAPEAEPPAPPRALAQPYTDKPYRPPDATPSLRRPRQPGPARRAVVPRPGGVYTPATRARSRPTIRRSPISWSPRWSRPIAHARRSRCCRAGSRSRPRARRRAAASAIARPS